MNPYAKAIYAAISGGVVALLSALLAVLTGDMTIAELTQAQWIAIVLATLGGAGVTGVGVRQIANSPDAATQTRGTL